MARRFGLKVTGLHFHVGCGYLTDQLHNWEKAVAAALWFLAAVPEVRSVNVVGGLGIPHRALDYPLDLERLAAVPRRQFAVRNATIAVATGGYIVKDAGILFLSV